MIHQGVFSHLSGSQMLYIAFVAYANFQVAKWIFKFSKSVLTSDLMAALINKLTPNSIIEKKQIRAKLKKLQEKQQKEIAHKEALESHRKYRAPFFNLQFISEDRATLFKGFNIKWQEGNQKTGQTKKPWVIENHEIAFLMFREMGAVRLQLLNQQGKWTSDMEKFWLKILPKQFVSKEKKMTDLERAIIEFEDDKTTKTSA